MKTLFSLIFIISFWIIYINKSYYQIIIDSGVCGLNNKYITYHSSSLNSIIGTGRYIGGLCGYNSMASGKIGYSFSHRDTISGLYFIGGFIGYNNKGTIKKIVIK